MNAETRRSKATREIRTGGDQLVSPHHVATPSAGVQPSQRKSKQQRHLASKENASIGRLNRRRRDSNSDTKSFHSNSSRSKVATAASLVPKLNLNLQADPSVGANNSFRRLKHNQSAEGNLHAGLGRTTNSRSVNVMAGCHRLQQKTSQTFNKVNTLKSPTTAQMPENFALHHTASGKVQNSTRKESCAYSGGSSTIQYTPLRQQSKGQPLQKSAMAQHVQASKIQVDLSDPQKGRNQDEDQIIQNRIMVSPPMPELGSEDDDEIEMEFALHGAVAESTGLQQIEQGAQHRMSRNGVESLELSGTGDSEPENGAGLNNSSQQLGKGGGRVPRQDRRKRRLLNSEASGGLAEHQSRAGLQLKSLVEQTSLDAAKRIDAIEQERLNRSKRSRSRSSKKAISQSLTESACKIERTPAQHADDSVQGNRHKTSQLFRKHANNALYQSMSAHQCPRFDIELNSATNTSVEVVPQPRAGPSVNPHHHSVHIKSSEESYQDNVRVNKFGTVQSRREEQVSFSHHKSMERRVSETRSNVSLSITRRNKELSATATEALNKLVQSSVMNLEKILQRPATNQDHIRSVHSHSMHQDDQALGLPLNSHRQNSQNQQKLAEVAEATNSKTTKARSFTSAALYKRQSPTNEPLEQPLAASPDPLPQEMSLQDTLRSITQNLPLHYSHKSLYESTVQQKKPASQKRSPRTSSSLMMSKTTKQQAAAQPASSSQQSQARIQVNQDLSVIAESVHTNSHLGESEHKKKYMQMTATAQARQDAANQQRNGKSTGNQKHAEIMSLKKLHEQAPVQAKTSARRAQQLEKFSARSREGAAAFKQDSLPTELRQPVATSLIDKESAARKIQRLVRAVLTKVRVTKFAHFAFRLQALFKGYKVRRFFKLQQTRNSIKEIQMMLRREARQTTSFLKEQQRKRIRQAIAQLISQCNSYQFKARTMRSAATKEQEPSHQSSGSCQRKSGNKSRSQSRQNNPTPSQATFIPHKTVAIIQADQKTIIADKKGRFGIQLRPSTARHNMDTLETYQSENMRSDADPSAKSRDKALNSTLRKTTQSYRMKTGATGQPSGVVQSAEGLQPTKQASDPRAKASHRSGKSLGESHSQFTLHQKQTFSAQQRMKEAQLAKESKMLHGLNKNKSKLQDSLILSPKSSALQHQATQKSLSKLLSTNLTSTHSPLKRRQPTVQQHKESPLDSTQQCKASETTDKLQAKKSPESLTRFLLKDQREPRELVLQSHPWFQRPQRAQPKASGRGVKRRSTATGQVSTAAYSAHQDEQSCSQAIVKRQSRHRQEANRPQPSRSVTQQRRHRKPAPTSRTSQPRPRAGPPPCTTLSTSRTRQCPVTRPAKAPPPSYPTWPRRSPPSSGTRGRPRARSPQRTLST